MSSRIPTLISGGLTPGQNTCKQETKHTVNLGVFDSLANIFGSLGGVDLGFDCLADGSLGMQVSCVHVL